jgi:UDP-N-acetylmuramoylalanine-D-glutamate ligase
LAGPNDVVLFSPAFASFGLFVNEYERNDLFVKIVNNYAAS